MAEGRETWLFLIHGYGASSASWHLVKDQFPAGYAMVPIDLVGFGALPPPQEFNFSLPMQAAALAQEIHTRQSHPVSIVAHSMGAAVVLIAMIDFGLVVDQLVLVDPLVYPQPIPFFIRLQTIPFFSQVVTHLVPPSIQVDLVLRSIYFNQKKINLQIRKQYIDAYKRPHHRRTLIETAKQLQIFDATKYTSRLHQIRNPVSIIWSRQDPLLSFELSKRFQSDLKGSVLFPIEDCGHAPQEECPAAFLAAVKKALLKGSRA